ncbi:flagellar hook assembly protein FlgD [Euryhalocaulis caribicus]|uniref:flagellar hook assembly protein FlgD n=1 Tax=Euryhalocaulis caribicus TaxID=1161401 RepID=UPI00039C5727|nr:flagellar hook capping FlgD N-terminal domain-containing protein [Euryhalocaulis caribicus]
MDIGGIASQGQAAGATNASASLANNFETFLTLLTEQMKNQDPLNPLESTEFMTQLVQFSGVEQQIKQNESLETMIGLQYAAAFGSTASYLGREATVFSNQSPLIDGQAKWSYNLPQDAAENKLVVTDEKGRVVFETEGALESGDHEFVWDGTDNNGDPLEDGVYTMKVTALNEDGDKITARTTVTGRVTGADFTGAEPALLIGDLRVALGSVKDLREAQAPATEDPAA